MTSRRLTASGAVVARPLSLGIKPGRYRLWGPTYLRLWTLDMLLAIGPLPVLSGSPMMTLYLRVLGARWIGCDVALGGRLKLGAGGLGVLGYDHETPALARWNTLLP